VVDKLRNIIITVGISLIMMIGLKQCRDIRLKIWIRNSLMNLIREFNNQYTNQITKLNYLKQFITDHTNYELKQSDIWMNQVEANFQVWLLTSKGVVWWLGYGDMIWYNYYILLKSHFWCTKKIE